MRLHKSRHTCVYQNLNFADSSTLERFAGEGAMILFNDPLPLSWLDILSRGEVIHGPAIAPQGVKAAIEPLKN